MVWLSEWRLMEWFVAAFIKKFHFFNYGVMGYKFSFQQTPSISHFTQPFIFIFSTSWLFYPYSCYKFTSFNQHIQLIDEWEWNQSIMNVVGWAALRNNSFISAKPKSIMEILWIGMVDLVAGLKWRVLWVIGRRPISASDFHSGIKSFIPSFHLSWFDWWWSRQESQPSYSFL